MKISKLLTVRNFVYLVLAVLAVTLYFQCRGNKAKKAEIVTLTQENERVNKSLAAMANEYSILKDAAPVGVVVQEGGNAQPGTIFITDWKQLEKEREHIRKLSNDLNAAVKANDSITLKYFELLGGSTINWVDFTETLPIIETVEIDTGKNFEFEARILSRGQLHGYEHKIKVTPEILTTVETRVEKVKAKNYIGFTAGILWMDDNIYDDVFLPIGLVYGRKAWQFDATVITNTGFSKIEGGQVKATIGLKW